MNNLLYNFMRVLAFPVVNILLLPKIKNKKNLKVNKSCIVIANHTSNWDPIVLGFLIHPKNLHYMAKVELTKNKLAGKFLMAMGIIPVTRGRGDLKAVKNAIKVLKADDALGIFPEGRRSENGNILPFEAGVSVIAVKTHTPVLPVYIHGNGYKLFHRVRVNVGEQFHLDELIGDQRSNDMIEHATEILREKLIALQKEVLDEK